MVVTVDPRFGGRSERRLVPVDDLLRGRRRARQRSDLERNLVALRSRPLTGRRPSFGVVPSVDVLHGRRRGWGNAFTWNGSSWSSPSSFDASGGPLPVSCPSTTFCAVVDQQGDALTWNGTVCGMHRVSDTADSDRGAVVSCTSSQRFAWQPTSGATSSPGTAPPGRAHQVPRLVSQRHRAPRRRPAWRSMTSARSTDWNGATWSSPAASGAVQLISSWVPWRLLLVLYDLRHDGPWFLKWGGTAWS